MKTFRLNRLHAQCHPTCFTGDLIILKFSKIEILENIPPMTAEPKMRRAPEQGPLANRFGKILVSLTAPLRALTTPMASSSPGVPKK